MENLPVVKRMQKVRLFFIKTNSRECQNVKCFS